MADTGINPQPGAVAKNALQGLPLGNMIGSPLKACIDAQVMSNRATVKYLQEIGFAAGDKGGPLKANMLEFTYVAQAQKADGTPEDKVVSFSVPLIAIAPPPMFQVNTCTIDFTANINAESSSVSEIKDETEKGVEGKASWSGWGAEVEINASYSSKNSSTATKESKYSVEYTLNVHVEAGTADMPAGLATVLNIMNNAIQAKPAKDPK